MKAFRFTLQALKTLRQRQEHVALELYAQAVRVRQQAVERWQAAQQELQKVWAQRQSQLAAGCPAAELVRSQAYGRVLEARGKECEIAVQAAQESVRQQWERLLAARQQREAVDRFYARQRERYAREGRREEQKVLDERANRKIQSTTTAKLTRDFFWN